MTTPRLPSSAFDRYDETPDANFYVQPRFVTHIDDKAIEAVTQLYREYFPPNSNILDLMSSWISHLPPEIAYSGVTGLGMNSEELVANKRLTRWLVQDLNHDPVLPFEDNEFDACGICVSIQYLTSPSDVLREVARVLKPGAPIVITFSNRCFPTKAVAIWQALSDHEHALLVERYLKEAGGWENITALNRTKRSFHADPLYAVVATTSKPQPTTEETK